jgi:hypothetical protein
MSGTVDVAEPMYLGTFALRASDQASGTFRVNVRTDSSTQILNEMSEEIPFYRGADAVITVGSGAGIGRAEK